VTSILSKVAEEEAVVDESKDQEVVELNEGEGETLDGLLPNEAVGATEGIRPNRNH